MAWGVMLSRAMHVSAYFWSRARGWSPSEAGKITSQTCDQETVSCWLRWTALRPIETRSAVFAMGGEHRVEIAHSRASLGLILILSQLRGKRLRRHVAMECPSHDVCPASSRAVPTSGHWMLSIIININPETQGNRGRDPSKGTRRRSLAASGSPRRKHPGPRL